MKRSLILIATAALLVGLGCWAHAFETDFDDIRRYDGNLMWWKFGRGFTNAAAGPYELFTNMANQAVKGAYVGAYDGGLQGYLAGSTNGYIAGFFYGLYRGVQRTTLGVLEMLTFWKPEYGPTLDPVYGTRNDTFGSQDYFNPDPFWYNGPTR
jgi:putative exosortase-associated protein (TIGR04073 family)